MANAKLLRLADIGANIAKLGGAAALVTKVAELKGQAKDKDFSRQARHPAAAAPARRSTQTLSRKASKAEKSAKAAPKAAPSKAVTVVKAAVAAVKAAVGAGPAKAAKKPAKKKG